MNWRHFVGSRLRVLSHAVLASRALPLSRYVPRGTFVLYDIQRFAQSRRLDVIFDVGANAGQSAWGFTRYFRDAQIYCFEPGRAAFTELIDTYGPHHGLHCLNLALGEKSETRELVVADTDTERSTFAPAPNMRHFPREICKVIALDEFCATEQISGIDLLKMDVQGWELAVLSGAQAMLRANRVRFVLSEVGFVDDERDMTFFPHLHERMQSLGFRFCGFYDSYRYGQQKEFVGFSNALYVNPNWAKAIEASEDAERRDRDM